MNLKGMLFQQGNCSVVPPDELPVLRLVVANHRENTLHFLTVKSRSEKVVLISLPDMRTLTLESLGTALSLAIDLQDHLALRFDSDAKQALSGPLPRGAALVIGRMSASAPKGVRTFPGHFASRTGRKSIYERPASTTSSDGRSWSPMVGRPQLCSAFPKNPLWQALNAARPAATTNLSCSRCSTQDSNHVYQHSPHFHEAT